MPLALSRGSRALLMAVVVTSAVVASPSATAAVVGFVSGAGLTGIAAASGGSPGAGFDSNDSRTLGMPDAFYHETLNLRAEGPTSKPAVASFVLDSQATGAIGAGVSIHVTDALDASATGCGLPAAQCVSAVRVPVGAALTQYFAQFDLTGASFLLDVSATTSALFSNVPAGVTIIRQILFRDLTPGGAGTLFDYNVSYDANGAVLGTPAGPVSTTIGPGKYQLLAQTFFSGYGNAGLTAATLSFDATTNLDIAPVPLPAAAWLMLSGLGGIAAFVRRRRATPAA